MKKIVLTLFLTFLGVNSFTIAQVITTTINPESDASIFEQNTTQGAGGGPLHSGHSCSGYSTRALLRFLLFSIPPGSTILSANLTLNVISVDPAGTDTGHFIVHPLTFGFSEYSGGSATPANWYEAGGGYTISYWTTPGGDYSLDTLSSQLIPPSLGLQNFPTSNTFVSYVQSWLDDPLTNHGMILIADTSTCNTLRSFDSWEMPVPPVLEVTYALPCNGPTAICQDLDVYLDGTGNATIADVDLDGGSLDDCAMGLTYSASQTSFSCADVSSGGGNGLIISGVYDGPLLGGTPKGVELYAGSAIADLSNYGIGSANNGGGTDGEEFTFPAVSVPAGSFIYVATDSAQFNAFFGFNPDFVDGSMAINGDDAIELFQGGSVIDVFGDINVDGTGQPWEYLDGWAYRNDLQGANGGVFNSTNWFYSGINAFDPDTLNATSATPFPVGTFAAGGGGIPVTLTVTDGLGNVDSCVAMVTVWDTIAPFLNEPSLPQIIAPCSATPSAPTATDLCANNVIITGTTNVVFPVTSTTTITWFFDDGNGNISSQDQQVLISGYTAVATLSGNTLTASTNGPMWSYQWIDCSDSSSIAGATGQTFTPSVTGNYAVIITTAGCSDTSDCVNVNIGSIQEQDIDLGMSISPNPSTGIFNLTFDNIVSGIVSIVDANGRLVQTQKLNGNSMFIDLKSTEGGLYFINVTTENGVSRARIVKE